MTEPVTTDPTTDPNGQHDKKKGEQETNPTGQHDATPNGQHDKTNGSSEN